MGTGAVSNVVRSPGRLTVSAGEQWRRRFSEVGFTAVALGALSVALVVLCALLIDLVLDGAGRLSWSFLTSFPSRHADKAGIYSPLIGSIFLIVVTAAIAVPLGIGAAVYLEEYAGRNRFTRIIELTIVNLAGVPSIIFGLLGLQLFVRYAGLGRSLIAGALTMSLLVLPVIVMATREALRAVPGQLRDASLALGATKWQTIRIQILPVAFPGILTGCILGLSRAIGETAPLVTIGALAYVAFIPDGLSSPFTVIPIQAFNWISRPQTAFHENAAAAIVVLLVILLTLNSIAIWLRYKLQVKSRL
jgi:phosphate transport system permease protein